MNREAFPDAEQITTMQMWASVVESVREEYLSEAQEFPWIVGFSGGKDSTLVLHAVFEAMSSVAPSRRTRPVHIVSNDTLVESPLVLAHLDTVAATIRMAAENLSLPITVARTKPAAEQSFWFLLIGKGYPSPTRTMRWCTDRLKILPTSAYIKDHISQSGAAIVVLGVRRDESATRLRAIERRRNARGTNLTPHSDLMGAFVYRPIVDLTTEEVWEVLGTLEPPWGGTHAPLIKLYRDAEGGECPVVLSKADAPGCGTSSSRFGCWTCTVVEKDKSLQGFIDVGNHQYKPLVEFRDWLKDIRDKQELRQAYRRNGKLAFHTTTGKPVPGPFTIKARKMILERLKETEAAFGAKLITDEELDLIYQQWNAELQQAKEVSNG